MYPLFESIKVVDGNLVNLEWHQRRVDNSRRKLLGETDHLKLKDIIEVPEEFTKDVVKCRMSYGLELGTVIFSNYVKRQITSLQQVESELFDYSFKYEDRTRLDQLYEQWGPCDEVLITHDGIIKDTSYSNVVLYDGQRWYTPEQPLLEGTQRAKLLAARQIKQRKIYVVDLPYFKKLVLINAMLEFEPHVFIRIPDIKLS